MTSLNPITVTSYNEMFNYETLFRFVVVESQH